MGKLSFLPLQVKEMGVMATDCECLAADAERLFEVYWYLARPGASIPSPWPSSYSAFFNMSNPASITINNTAALAYWAVSRVMLCCFIGGNWLDIHFIRDVYI